MVLRRGQLQNRWCFLNKNSQNIGGIADIFFLICGASADGIAAFTECTKRKGECPVVLGRYCFQFIIVEIDDDVGIILGKASKCEYAAFGGSGQRVECGWQYKLLSSLCGRCSFSHAVDQDAKADENIQTKNSQKCNESNASYDGKQEAFLLSFFLESSTS